MTTDELGKLVAEAVQVGGEGAGVATLLAFWMLYPELVTALIRETTDAFSEAIRAAIGEDA